AQLLAIGAGVQFRHPLVRSAVLSSATTEERARAHLALANATNPHGDPARRVWHLAAAATGFDDAVASELERLAGRARVRAGLAGAAAFLARASSLTADPALRADRAFAAAQAYLQSGDFDAARGLVLVASAGAADDLRRARVAQLSGQIEAAS